MRAIDRVDSYRGQPGARGQYVTTKSTSQSSRKVVSSLTVEQLSEDWYRAQRARNLSTHTVKSRRQTIALLVAFLRERDLSTRIAEITRRDLEDFFIELREHVAASSVNLRFTALRAFFNWCVDEEELSHSPMARLKAPVIEERSPEVLTRADLEALLKTCAGKSFNDRRDRAIFLLLIDTGMRLHEIAQLTLDTIDLDAQTFSILGKGKRERTPHFDVTADAALAAYLRARTRYTQEHPQHATLRALWIGKRGPLGNTGIYQMMVRRAKQAGIEGVHPHLFRHGFADAWLEAGGTEGALAELAGWVPGSKMLHRYGKARSAARAREAHKQFSPANRLLRPGDR